MTAAILFRKQEMMDLDFLMKICLFIIQIEIGRRINNNKKSVIKFLIQLYITWVILN